MYEPRMLGPTRFRFLNKEYDLGEYGWDDRRIDRLWRYNLHYFDDLNTDGALERLRWHTALLDRWIAENPVGCGIGWEPYPASLRIVNWIKWFLRGVHPHAHWLDSLAVQVRWLFGRIEWHLLGNHILANAKALIFAGLFFDGPEADKWLRKGLSLLDEQLTEQILPDGGHFELSPMYHAIVLTDLLDLINLFNTFSSNTFDLARTREVLASEAAKMLWWLRCMTHPDGHIGFFNDAALGVAVPTAEIEAYAARLVICADKPPRDGVVALRASGYVRVVRGPMCALLDIAPIGPDYLPGHGHADTLSFELSLGKRRIIVNGGTSCYGTSEQRLRERGTAWHSTVQVAGKDSSEVWASFRVGRRAMPGPIAIDGWQVEGCHDGYRFLPGKPIHTRKWNFTEDGLSIEDTVSPALHPAVSRFHLGPGLSLEAGLDGKSFCIWDHSERICLAHVDVIVGKARISSSGFAPEFGIVIPIQTLEVEFTEDGKTQTVWKWKDAYTLLDRQFSA